MTVLCAMVGPAERACPNKSADVKAVQRLLLIASINKGRIDWHPGPLTGMISKSSKTDKTLSALRAFQKTANIPVDGIIAPYSPSLKKLDELVRLARIDLGKSKPVMIAKTKRRPGFDAKGNVANDMKYGDYSKDQIKNVRGMFAIDDATIDLDKVSADHLFAKFTDMSTSLFATGKLEKNIIAMIAKFKSNSGGRYSDPRLTEAARVHEKTRVFENEIRNKLSTTLRKLKGNIFSIKPNIDFVLTKRIYFNTTGDIIGGLTIATNDIWAYDVEIVEYAFDGLSYTGKYRITLYDHFGLDEPDVDNSKNYGYLAGFRSWFILQHLQRFAYKPFITVIKLESTFSGSLK